MSKEQLDAFLEAARANGALQDKLKVAADADAIVSIASEAGFVIAKTDLRKVKAESSSGELGEEELEEVVGGACICWSVFTQGLCA